MTATVPILNVFRMESCDDFQLLELHLQHYLSFLIKSKLIIKPNSFLKLQAHHSHFSKNIFKIFLISCAVLFQIVPSNAQEEKWSDVPGTVITYQSPESGLYIGSPSIAILPNGDYVASHDFFGPESSEHLVGMSRIYTSQDKGRTRTRISEIRGAFWSSLFVHRGDLYLMGPDRHHGAVLVRRSEDGGHTWTEPSHARNGLVRRGMFHCAPMPVIEHNGRLWRAMETAHGPDLAWGKRYGAMMMSAPADADLLQAENWTVSNPLLYDSTYLDGNFTGWLEGNAVVAPDGEIVIILRTDDRTTYDEKASIVQVSSDGKRASFDPETGFIPFEGGGKKFAIRYDDPSKRYWTLSNAIRPKYISEFPERNAPNIRNTLVLMSSENLRDWTIHEIILKHPDVIHTGFQYVDWLTDGEDMIAVSRTAYFDGEKPANSHHNANFLTFHRIENFREKIKEEVALD